MTQVNAGYSFLSTHPKIIKHKKM